MLIKVLSHFTRKHILLLVLVILLLIGLLAFIVDSLNLVQETNKNNFEYTIKVRNTIEEIDIIVDRAGVNVNVLVDTVVSSYDTRKLYDEKYNIRFVAALENLVRSILINSPGIDSVWYQPNADLPFSDNLYIWLASKNGKIVDFSKDAKGGELAGRKINPKDDPYYFEAVSARDIIWTKIYVDKETNTRMLTIAEPVYKNGILIGVVGVDISVANLQLALKNMQLMFEYSEIFLLDENKNLIIAQLSNIGNKTHHNHPFLTIFKDKSDKLQSMVEFYDEGVRKTAIMMPISNNYNIVITFPNSVVFRGYDRLFKTIYFIFAVLSVLASLSLYTRIKIMRMNTRLKNEANKLKTIINASPSIILMKDLNGVYTDCNQTFLDLMQIEKEDLVGKTDYALFDEPEIEEILKNDNIVKETKEILIQESYYFNKEGKKFAVEKYIVPLLDTDKNLVGILIIGYDITRRWEEQAQLERAKEAAEKATMMKSSFLANMSHEIRTPMNGVFGFLQLLEETDTSEIQKEFIADAQKASSLLLSIINEILDYSKIEAGKLRIDNLSFDIRSAVEDVTVIATSNACSKNLDINSLICTDVPQNVYGDPGRIKQILNNLVGNAIKFTNKGEITVYVNQESETDDESVISFKVKDTGIGIPEDKLKIIFESFNQADVSTTRKFGGTGLGLAISVKLAELMNGTLNVESVENVGSTFTLTIPFKKDKSINQDLNSPLAPYLEVLKGANILIVDNKCTDLKIIHYYLNEASCHISEAQSVEEAIACLHKENSNISVVLIDDKMEYSGGVELSTLIKESEHSKDIPLILYTTLSKKGELTLTKGKGFSGHLIKPIKKMELLKALAIALGGNLKDLDTEMAAKRLIRERKFDSKAKILVVEDCDLNCKLILRILVNAGLSCDLALNGRSAVDSFKNNKYDLILMDCEMPILDGYEATKEIRELENEDRTPIIAMTANVLNADKEKCFEFGMDDYISKPIDISKLLYLIGKYIKIEPRKIENNENSGFVNKNDYIEHIIYELISELEFTRSQASEIFAQYVEMLPKAIADLEEAIDQGDFEQLRKMAHKLKGSSSNLRVKKMAEFCESFQNAVHQENKEACLAVTLEMKNHYERCLNIGDNSFSTHLD